MLVKVTEGKALLAREWSILAVLVQISRLFMIIMRQIEAEYYTRLVLNQL